MAELTGELAQYVCDGNEAVEMRLVTCPDDLKDFHEDSSNDDDDQVSVIPSFKPLMVYQAFGQEENIFGYQDLQVRVYYSAARLNIYTGLKYSKIIDPEVHKGIKADPVLKMIADDYETDIVYNIDEFSKSLEKEKSFVPPGTSVSEFHIDIRQKTEDPKEIPTTKRKFFQVFAADFDTPGFLSYHSKMQTFLKWFIEAANYLETDDKRFEFLMVYQKLPINGQPSDKCPTEFQYVFAGYCSVVRFYHYPEQIRPKISQFLILPPFQGHGLGTKLLENLFNYYNNSKVYDITVESPEPEFQLMMDTIDVQRCQGLKEFSLRQLRDGYNKAMAVKARELFKIHAPQARRVYEILRLLNIKASDGFEMKAFTSHLHKRLDNAYQQQIHRLEKLKNRYSEEAFGKMMQEVYIPQDVRNAEIEQQIALLREDYDKVIARVLRAAV